MRALKKRLRKFNLELSEEKSRLLRFGKFAPEKAKRERRKAETFDFLGFTHYCSKDRKGNYKVGHKTTRKRYIEKVKEMKIWLKAVRNIKIKEWWGILIAKIRGHYQYYGISGNTRCLERFYQEIRRLLFKWLNRRSQKRSFTSKSFQLYLERYPLPRPKLYYNLYENRAYRGEC
jgi:RNA-directed DNA polymerase